MRVPGVRLWTFRASSSERRGPLEEHYQIPSCSWRTKAACLQVMRSKQNLVLSTAHIRRRRAAPYSTSSETQQNMVLKIQHPPEVENQFH
ncbi:hypothetical protein EYF80_064131 [Liparis tanakae]|uniref:Uncharacterized protein n=1 Tax=Liparis tanakae TaxID=230148 RepID=A0A4Z2EA63_9TELE|nr:hypothetical protein EYF80_064131 [Liparis tanakae]